MTSRELFLKFESLQAELRRNEFLLKLVATLGDRQAEVTKMFGAVVASGDPNSSWSATERIRNRLRETISEVKLASPRKIFAEIEAVVETISDRQSVWNHPTLGKLELLKREFELFGAAYESFISGQQVADMAQLLSAAQRLDAAANSSVEFASVVLKNLCPNLDDASDSDRGLELYLASQTDFSLFLEKATALERVYEELCELFKVSSKQEPLRIVKIESGSLWAWLRGDPGTLAAARSVIEKAAHYFYRNYTDEGKLSAIPKKVETIDSVLQLRDELKKRDIPTEQLEEHITKASVAIGKNLETLLAGEDQIELNGVVIALTPASQQGLIASRRVRLIEEQNPESPGKH
jgi:hypothetical protein